MFLDQSIQGYFNPKTVFETVLLKEGSDDIFMNEIVSQENLRIDSDILIKYHKIYGNKWKEISSHLANTSDAFIKNMFYTLARKALRKVNLYIEHSSKIKNKKSKVFKLNFVFKLANLAESERISDSRDNLKSLKGYYTKLLYNLLEIGKFQNETIKQSIQSDSLAFNEEITRGSLDALIQNLRVIQKIFIEQNLIKKGRTKKKFPKKGLIEKAYSSKAFKDSLDEFQTLTHLSLSSTHSKQHNEDQISFLGSFSSQKAWELKTYVQNNFETKNDLDSELEMRSFDPILFE